MGVKTLVAYASRTGYTTEVAEMIGGVLREADMDVDVRPIKEVADVSPYEAVIVGTAVRVGKPVPETVRFVNKHRQALSRMRVAFFAVCMTMCEPTAENYKKAHSFLEPLIASIDPVDVGMFAGAMEYRRLPFLPRLMLSRMKVPEGDFRDWPAIRAWAAALAPRLVPTPAEQHAGD